MNAIFQNPPIPVTTARHGLRPDTGKVTREVGSPEATAAWKKATAIEEVRDFLSQKAGDLDLIDPSKIAGLRNIRGFKVPVGSHKLGAYWRQRLAGGVAEMILNGQTPTHYVVIRSPSYSKESVRQLLADLEFRLTPIYALAGLHFRFVASYGMAWRSADKARKSRKVDNVLGVHADILLHIPSEIIDHVSIALTELNARLNALACRDNIHTSITTRNSNSPVHIQTVDDAAHYRGQHGLAGLLNYSSKHYPDLSKHAIGMVHTDTKNANEWSPVILSADLHCDQMNITDAGRLYDHVYDHALTTSLIAANFQLSQIPVEASRHELRTVARGGVQLSEDQGIEQEADSRGSLLRSSRPRSGLQLGEHGNDQYDFVEDCSRSEQPSAAAAGRRGYDRRGARHASPDDRPRYRARCRDRSRCDREHPGHRLPAPSPHHSPAWVRWLA